MYILILTLVTQLGPWQRWLYKPLIIPVSITQIIRRINRPTPLTLALASYVQVGPPDITPLNNVKVISHQSTWFTENFRQLTIKLSFLFLKIYRYTSLSKTALPQECIRNALRYAIVGQWAQWWTVKLVGKRLRRRQASSLLLVTITLANFFKYRWPFHSIRLALLANQSFWHYR